MVRGFYSAAAGVLSQQKAIDAIANNITNAATAGYKSQSTAESSFGKHLVARMTPSPGTGNSNIGPGAFMTVNSETYVDFTQGMMENTGRSVDMAIQGEGFFVISSEKYGDLLTRNGQFELDADGNLMLPGVGKVQNESGGEINLESSSFSVGKDGTIYVGGKEADKINIASVNENPKLVKIVQGSFFSAEGYEQAEAKNYNVIQGAVEKANVNIAKEMSRIIAGQGNFTSCTEILKIYDKINELAVNRIGNIE
ncbi:flagellar basal-body rod protein FlgF [Bacillota bacterium]